MFKDDVTTRFQTKNKWNIDGLPKSIILDNAKEFVSPHLNEFLDRHNIIKRFNPVKTPNYKPYVRTVDSLYK